MAGNQAHTGLDFLARRSYPERVRFRPTADLSQHLDTIGGIFGEIRDTDRFSVFSELLLHLAILAFLALFLPFAAQSSFA